LGKRKRTVPRVKRPMPAVNVTHAVPIHVMAPRKPRRLAPLLAAAFGAGAGFGGSGGVAGLGAAATADAAGGGLGFGSDMRRYISACGVNLFILYEPIGLKVF
jgi:hypothetical protein